MGQPHINYICEMSTADMLFLKLLHIGVVVSTGYTCVRRYVKISANSMGEILWCVTVYYIPLVYYVVLVNLSHKVYN